MDSLWCAYPAIRMMTAVCEMFYGPVLRRRHVPLEVVQFAKCIMTHDVKSDPFAIFDELPSSFDKQMAFGVVGAVREPLLLGFNAKLFG